MNIHHKLKYYELTNKWHTAAFIYRANVVTGFQNHETRSRLTQHTCILIWKAYYRAIYINLKAKSEDRTALRREPT